MAVPETETRSKGGKLIALTFDDGPGPYTRRLLEGLAKRGVKATFFMLGQQAENYDVTAGLVRDAGHQIASHTYDHPQLSKKTDSQVTWQISHTADILNGITGYGTHYLVRPPYGDYNSRVLSLLDNPAILWSVDPLDWKYRNADTVCTNIVEGAFDGAIVLAHDIHSTTVDGVLMAIDKLQAKGYEFVTVNELFRRRGVTLEKGHTYSSCKPTGTDLGPVSVPTVTDGVLMAIDKLQAKGYEFVTVNELFRRRGVTLEKGHTYSSCKPTGTDLGPVSVPTVTEAGGQVTISADKGTTIYYTLDGSSPLASGKVYTGPFAAKSGQTVRAVAAYNRNGSASAETAVKVRGITLKEPTVRALNGKVMISNPNPNSELRYTLDGSAPTERSAVYPSSGLEFFTGILRYRVFAKEGCGQTYTLYLSKSGHLFRDVPTNSWYFESIDRAVSLDLLKGVGDFAYEPDGGLNRAMFVTMLARAVGESLPDSAAGFSDVKGGQWYTAAMSWALRKNLIRGYEDGSYRPEALITREEMCVILDRLMQQRGETLHTGKLSFADTASISAWARDSVARMTALGLIRGAENNRFFPQRTTTRAEAATVMLRIYDHLH